MQETSFVVQQEDFLKHWKARRRDQRCQAKKQAAELKAAI